MKKNILYYGDNLEVMRLHMNDESVDLIYLDPPFNSKRDYNVFLPEPNGSRSTAQVKAFKDTWSWDREAMTHYQDVVEAGGKLSQVLQAFRLILGEGGRLAYIAMMAPRLKEMHRILTPTGSLYLHCDPTASHYLRILLDTIFSADHFLNEIVWCYSIGGKSRKMFGRKHDVILWYSKGNQWTFNENDPLVRVSRKPDSHMKVITDENGITWQEKTDTKTGKTYRYALDKVPEDYWLGIEQLNRSEKERLGYPTQKPEALLERIIAAGSNENDVVFDPFCGCGTAVAVAQRLNRHWIGIDIKNLAIKLIKERLNNTFDGKVEYEVRWSAIEQENAEWGASPVTNFNYRENTNLTVRIKVAEDLSEN